jgi:hypothetical protein
MGKCIHVKETLKGCICSLTECQKCFDPLADECDRPEQHYYEQMAKEEVEE